MKSQNALKPNIDITKLNDLFKETISTEAVTKKGANS